MSMNNFEKTKYFNKTFGILVNEVYDSKLFTDNGGVVKYRLDLIQEEISELEEGLKKNSFLEVLDALADILYVSYGCGVTIGLNLESEFKKALIGTETSSDSNFTIVKKIFADKDDGEPFTGKLEGSASYDAVKSVIEQMRELYNKLYNACRNVNSSNGVDDSKEIIAEHLVSIIQMCYYIGFLIKVDVDHAFDLVHVANMTKACDTEELAKATVEKYLQDKASFSGEGEYPYQFPAYRASEDGKYWIIFNDDRRENPKFAGKILKSMNWVEADFSEYVV